MMQDVLYDSAAAQLEEELKRQFPAVKWRVPSSLDLMVDTMLAEQGGYPGAVAGNRLMAQARFGQHAAVVPVAVELVRHEKATAAQLTMYAAMHAMQKL
jgi:hypothetical protein